MRGLLPLLLGRSRLEEEAVCLRLDHEKGRGASD
jgi:hypothetical protein